MWNLGCSQCFQTLYLQAHQWINQTHFQTLCKSKTAYSIRPLINIKQRPKKNQTWEIPECVLMVHLREQGWEHFPIITSDLLKSVVCWAPTTLRWSRISTTREVFVRAPCTSWRTRSMCGPRTSSFSLRAVHIPGHLNIGADILLR